jgi:hypothetical protein
VPEPTRGGNHHYMRAPVLPKVRAQSSMHFYIFLLLFLLLVLKCHVLSGQHPLEQQ